LSLRVNLWWQRPQVNLAPGFLPVNHCWLRGFLCPLKFIVGFLNGLEHL
jgi:hypothetical protein